MSSKKIAIIIPAYKKRFLADTLRSIAAQDCKDFKLYIGDDCSPEGLENIVDQFKGEIDLEYRKFSENMGLKDLPGHWARCIGMSSEPYVMLFSDDDILPSDAISRAIDAIRKYPGNEFFRFRLNLIDESATVFRANPDFTSPVSTAEELLIGKLSATNSSAAIEYIFSRKLFDRIGGFVKFPLGWCTDDATWYLMARDKGVVNIFGEPVSWRNVEGVNISDSHRSDWLKLEAVTSFLSWLHANSDRSFRRTRPFKQAIRTYINTILNTSVDCNFSKKELYRICLAAFRLIGLSAYKIYRKNVHKRKIK